MQVALDPAALLQADLDDPRARGLQLLDARAQLGVEALVLERQRGRAPAALDQARLLVQRGSWTIAATQRPACSILVTAR